MKNKKIIALILSTVLPVLQGSMNVLAIENLSVDNSIENKNNFFDEILQEDTLKLKDNVIDVLGFSNEKKFSIGFDTNKKEFKLYNQQNKLIHEYHSMLDKVYFTIRVFSASGNEKSNIELLGKDLGTTDKLNPLKKLKYESGVPHASHR